MSYGVRMVCKGGMQSGGEDGVQKGYAEWWCEWCVGVYVERGVGGVSMWDGRC